MISFNLRAVGIHISCIQKYAVIESSVDSLSDEQIRHKLASRKAQDRIRAPPPMESMATDCWRFGDDAIAKLCTCVTEAWIMSFVTQHTSIPVPHIRRIILPDPVDKQDGQLWVIMDRIQGRPLREALPELSWWKRLKVWWTIRSYYQQLHRVPLPPEVTAPGPFYFKAPGITFKCVGQSFPQQGAGPFTSYSDMARWFDGRRFDFFAYLCGADKSFTPEQLARAPTIADFPTSPPLVLCHMDFHQDNFILDKDGKVWMIDWGFAGAYPAWMEYAHILLRLPTYRRPSMWDRLRARFLVGDFYAYFREYASLMGWLNGWWKSYDCTFPEDYLERRGVEIVNGKLQHIKRSP
ncbi:kinase-like domain-containing protein [Coprinopsis sp. MPI-PUGE-AT-0042]|nr:kinase-like domain-containing protein [Coprinopsis sp. MPI-PUGE-AT-0042]